jgi:ferredoxin--NADP+ reductase
MPEYAVRALSESLVRDVYLLGRRGPAQAAFTNPELKELGDLAEADVIVQPGEAKLDPLSQEELEASGDRMLAKKVQLISEYASRAPQGRPRRLHLRFLVSPTELVDDGTGRVSAVNLVRNELVKSETGTLSARATSATETIPAGLVFRSVGYRGVPLSDVPFNERWGTIANAGGRVTHPDSGEQVLGEYAAGWIKRGPSGVIGTNKPDALESVTAMLEDAAAGKTWQPDAPSPDAVTDDLRARGVAFTTFEDWCALDVAELAAGERCGRPRVKFGSRDEMLRCLAGEGGPATA